MFDLSSRYEERRPVEWWYVHEPACPDDVIPDRERERLDNELYYWYETLYRWTDDGDPLLYLG